MPPVSTLRALRQRVRDVLLDLVHRRLVDQRARRDAALEAVADLELADRRRELVGERVVDAVLHVEAVGADAGLAGVAELGGDRAFDRRVEVGVVEDDERRVAAELQRDAS